MKEANYYVLVYNENTSKPKRRDFATWTAMKNYTDNLSDDIDFDVYEAHTDIYLFGYFDIRA